MKKPNHVKNDTTIADSNSDKIMLGLEAQLAKIKEKQEVQFTKLGKKFWKEYGTLNYKMIKSKIADSVQTNDVSSEDQEALNMLKELKEEYGTTDIKSIVESMKEKSMKESKEINGFSVEKPTYKSLSSNRNEGSTFR